LPALWFNELPIRPDTSGGVEKSTKDLERAVGNPWSRRKITKTAHAGRGQETKWEIPIIGSMNAHLITTDELRGVIKKQGFCVKEELTKPGSLAQSK